MNAPETASQRRLILAGVAVNVLEWYGFSVYGFFAVAIGRNFFPSKSTTTSLIADYAESSGEFAHGLMTNDTEGYSDVRRNRSRLAAFDITVTGRATL